MRESYIGLAATKGEPRKFENDAKEAVYVFACGDKTKNPATSRLVFKMFQNRHVQNETFMQE
jgi:hypothetical protein